MDCFFCIAQLLIARRDGVPLPVIREAETLYNGTAICRDHIILPEPGEPDDEPLRVAPRIQPAPPGTRIRRGRR